MAFETALTPPPQAKPSKIPQIPNQYMTPNKSRLSIKNLFRTSLVVCAGLGLFAIVTAAGERTTSAAPVNAIGDYAAMDPAVFGSSSGQASMKAAPTTWSSRSNVRWNARWSNQGRYLV